jgi:hypothetical protein
MTSRKFNAFISYSHADRRIGQRVFTRLDSYRTPKPLVGTAGKYGPVRDRLYPCFRDREELSASRDVKKSLDAALAAADHLVVLCSPAASRSTWVSHEIHEFARLKGADRIHAVLVNGAPEASFPRALTEVGIHSPLAADLAVDGDGFSDGTLKVAATLLGVSFGDLRDRERERRQRTRRRARALSAMFAVLFLAACGSGWAALQFSNQTQAAFATLVEGISQRVDVILLDEGRTMTVARLQQEIGFIQGLTDTALSIAPASPILNAERNRLDLLYAQSYLAVGDARSAKDLSLRALDRSRASYIGERQRDAVVEVRARRMLASSWEALGDDQRAIEVLLGLPYTLSTENSELLREVALARHDLASIWERQRNFQLARTSRAMGDKALEVLARSGDPRISGDRIASTLAKGDVALFNNNLIAADELYNDAYRAVQLALSGAPSDRRLLRTLSVTRERLARIALLRGSAEEAAKDLEAELYAAEAFSASDPESLSANLDVLLIQLQFACTISERGNAPEASRALASGLRAAKDLRVRLPNLVSVEVVALKYEIANLVLQEDGMISPQFLSWRGQLLDRADRVGLVVSPAARRAILSSLSMRSPGRRAAPTPVERAPD